MYSKYKFDKIIKNNNKKKTKREVSMLLSLSHLRKKENEEKRKKRKKKREARMVRQLTARPTSIFKVDLFSGFFSQLKLNSKIQLKKVIVF